MDSNGNDVTDNLSAALGRLGEVLFFLAVLALSGVSFCTSLNGLKTLIPVWQAFSAAFGLQSSMIAASILLSRARRVRQKLLFLAACILTASTSIFFSYIGLRTALAHQIADVRAPVIEKQKLSEEQTRLQQAATDLRGRALAHLETEQRTATAGLNVANANRDAKELKAREYESQLRAIQTEKNLAAADATLTAEGRAAQVASLQAQEEYARRLLAIAQATGEKLQLDAAESRISSQNIQSARDRLVAYAPDFLVANDWPALRASYNRLGAVWGLLPLDFQSANPLPKPPAVVVLENGRPTMGHDHPVVEAAWSIVSLREPSDIFALVLAILLDGIPLVSIFASAGRVRTFPERLANLRRWMAATTRQAELMPGAFPWMVRTALNVCWTPPVRIDDPRVAAFEDALHRLDLEMSEFLEGLQTPAGVFEAISVHLASLYSRASVIAFDSAEKLKNLAIRMYGVLSDAIENSTLSTADKQAARSFVQKHAARFTSAVDDCFTD